MSPDKISVKEIVEVLEGSINPVDEKVLDEHSGVKWWVTFEVWKELGQALINCLSSVTLGDLVTIYKKRVETGLYNI
jgi:DNA-binding IscR family transcriptional regulator